MANYLIKDTTLSNIANSIRNKTGSTEKIKVADMANEIAGISAGGGDTDAEDGLVTRQLISYTNDRVTSIGSYAFMYCKSLTTVNFPVCRSIGSYAFSNCTSLTTASFPVCTSIRGFAFSKCYNLSQLTLGASRVCTLAHSNAFLFTPFAGYSASFSGTPVIYVTASLVNAYKTATNWTYFSKYIQAIE